MSRNAASRVRGRAFHTHDASRLSSQFGGHPALHALQGLGQRGGIGAASHGHVGVAAAFAAYLLGNEVHEFACLDAAHGVGRDACGQLHFAFGCGGQHDGGGFELVFELVHRLAQGLGVCAIEAGGEHLHAMNADGLAGQFAALGGQAALRMSGGQPYVTDNGLHILDVRGLRITDPLAFENETSQWPGVVTVGVFARQKASCCLLATQQGVRTLQFD